MSTHFETIDLDKVVEAKACAEIAPSLDTEKKNCGCEQRDALISYLRPGEPTRVEFEGCSTHCREFWEAMSAPLRETAIIGDAA